MRAVHRKAVAATGLAALAIFGAAACSSDSAPEAGTTTAAVEASTSEAASAMARMADPAANLVGRGCAAYAQQVPTGPGSVTGMAQDPVTVAASNNPILNPEVNLVDTLNGGEFTVFAPTDEAFGKIDPATIEKLKTDAPLLTSILTYHVVPGQASPTQVAGDQKTVQGATVAVTGAGENIKVNDAGLVCGGVSTANATVYMIDTVLMPPAS
jgi:uncharacterized surface protein with fasciclin (FAS1) repeats